MNWPFHWRVEVMATLAIGLCFVGAGFVIMDLLKRMVMS